MSAKCNKLVSVLSNLLVKLVVLLLRKILHLVFCFISHLFSLNHTHTHTHIYIYIYIYIYCHPQTDCFVLWELFSVARHVGRSKTGSKPIQFYVRLSLRPLGQPAYHVWLRELLRYLCSNSSSVRLFTFLYPIEELCIMRAAAENSFTRGLNPHGGAYIYIYIYIYICVCVCVCVWT